MTAGPVTTELPFSARHYLDRLKALDPAPRGQKGFHRPQVEKLVQDLIGEVGRAQKTTTAALTDRDAAREALKYRADEYAAERHPWEGPPTLAIDAVVQGQLQAERTDRAANLEIAHRLANAERALREAEELRDQTKASATVEPPRFVRPAPPMSSFDPDSLADQAARLTYLQSCMDALTEHEAALAQWETDRREAEAREQAALDEQKRDIDEQQAAIVADRDGLVANLDRLADEVPQLRLKATAIDLTDGSADEPTQAMEIVGQ